MNNLWWLFLLIGIVVAIIADLVTYLIIILVLKHKRYKHNSNCICPLCESLYLDSDYEFCPKCGNKLITNVDYESIDVLDNVNVYHMSVSEEVYSDLLNGKRTFGLVEYHHNYNVGDHVCFYIKDEDNPDYMPSDLVFVITCIVKDVPELKDGCCVIGLQLKFMKAEPDEEVSEDE